MSSISYRIELEPLGDFFFGGENTFGENNSNNDNNATQKGKDKKNYFAKSNRFPQQSALLGMLRFELLKEKALLPLSQYKDEARQLIGGRSFDFERNSLEFDFGIIEKISPIFLTDSSQDFIPVPFDFKYQDNITWLNDNRVYIGGTVKSCQIDVVAYNVKEHSYESHYVGSHDKKSCAESVFFKSAVKVGVNTIKSRDGDDKEAYFKQEFIRMQEKKHHFAFYVQLKEDVFQETKDRLIFLGGEQSMFRMKIKKAENSYEQVCKGLFDIRQKIVLISDAYISSEQKEILDKAADFSWSDTVVFRNIKTSVKETTNYDNKPVKSDKKIHLIKKGSVFYYSSDKAKNEIVKSIENDSLKKCGFNLYIG